MKILLVGGGSGGPVTPLIAVAENIKQNHPKAEFLLVGTHYGPEKQMAEKAGIAFASISSGKWRRYFSPANFLTPFAVLAGFVESFKILKEFKPDCLFAAGSFVQVPVVWAAKMLRVPVVIHQQDLMPGLANKLCEHAANKITVSFADSLTDFSSGLGLFYRKNKNKIVLTGNPFRAEWGKASKENSLKAFNLSKDLPVLLVLGGGTGAEFINNLIIKALPELSRVVQIVHSTGVNKLKNVNSDNYHSVEFINNMDQAYAAADIVLCRAGLSTITEISNLEKVAIVIPMPDSHQELNAFMLDQLQAAIVLDQNQIKPEGFVKAIRRLLFEHNLQQDLKNNISKIMPKGSATKVADIIIKLAETYVS